MYIHSYCLVYACMDTSYIDEYELSYKVLFTEFTVLLIEQ